MSASEGCKTIGLLVGAQLDGELDAVKTLEVEEHLTACETCRERLALNRAIRGSLKKTVKTAAPDDVKTRMLAAMTAESARQETASNDAANAKSGRGMLRHWRTMVPLASAAALALAWGAAANQPVVRGTPDVMRAGFANDDLLRDFVAQHSRAYPPEQRDPSELSRYVGVPVRAPHFKNARYVGTRLVTGLHGGEAAAMLQYEMKVDKAGTTSPNSGANGGVQRVTIFVYNPRNVHVGGSLVPRAVGTAEARMGQEDGYSVAVTTSSDGVGYTITSDLDAEDSAKLVAVVDHE